MDTGADKTWKRQEEGAGSMGRGQQFSAVLSRPSFCSAISAYIVTP